jgi:hypothetical protein
MAATGGTDVIFEKDDWSILWLCWRESVSEKTTENCAVGTEREPELCKIAFSI